MCAVDRGEGLVPPFLLQKIGIPLASYHRIVFGGSYERAFSSCLVCFPDGMRSVGSRGLWPISCPGTRAICTLPGLRNLW
jgi:hypothetical protein